MSTIVAISTAPITGGIGIIRMSGENSFKILNKIFIPRNKSKKVEGYKIKYGNIVDGKKIIDEVLVSYFLSPKSYTTEDMCEINTHGGIIIINKILDLCIKNGANLAEPGEFTKRAFLNGRIDLSQAEAVADLINAKSSKEAEASINQLEGYLSKTINNIKQKVLDMLVYVEAGIDYPEYDIEEVSNKRAIKTLKEVEEELVALKNTFENGKIIKNGIKTVILGRPNSGKSSLLNELVNEEKAIVTDIEGTTRDSIEAEISIEGIPFKFIDTAGIRKTDNKIEQIGINRAKKLAEESDLIIAIFDISKQLNKEDLEILEIINQKKAIIILNKTDLNKEYKEDIKIIEKYNKNIIRVSLLKKEGIKNIYNTLIKMFNLQEIDVDNSNVITNTRHKILIEKALENVEEAKQGLDNGIPIDIISINIKNIIDSLNEIIGENVSEELINTIFSKFCLGKWRWKNEL